MILYSSIRNKSRIRSIILITFVLLVFTGQAEGDDENPILVDPVGVIDSSHPFSISGFVTDPGCTWVGIEIFPKDYWEKAASIADLYMARGFRFSLRSVVQSITDEDVVSNDETYFGVFFHIFNPDGTIAYQPAPPCPDHRIHFARVIHDFEEKNTWSTTFNTDRDLRMLNPGRYTLLVWDASNQSYYVNCNIENIYDAKNQKIYPTTKKCPIWEPGNQKELRGTDFEVR